jgi:hypothetical protein
MVTLYNPDTDASTELTPMETERFRVALFETLKKHEVRKELREIAKTVKN